MFLTLFEGKLLFSDLSMESKNKVKNWSREELYIQFTKETSMIVK